MTANNQPLVSVVTPVYNGEKYLEECIESVLRQTYTNFDYLIVNNCSKDRSLEIAQGYARKDSRIRIHDNAEFLDIIGNHNHAFRQILPSVKYCKVVSADDLILPDCLRQMVEFADANPSVGVVGSYQQSGDRVRWQGFPYPQSVFPGREICREFILRHDPEFGFGAPTSLLYRADIVRETSNFFPTPSPQSDTSACFAAMQHSDFGFVYQVLSYERLHPETQTTKSAELNCFSPANLSDLQHYGKPCLSSEELDMAIKLLLDDYHRFLALNYFGKSRGEDFWNYHRTQLKDLGYPLKRTQLFKALLVQVMRGLGNPEQSFRKLQKSKSPKGPAKSSDPMPDSPATPPEASGLKGI